MLYTLVFLSTLFLIGPNASSPEECDILVPDNSRTEYVCPETKQKLKCPGESVGFSCDFTAPFSQRDGDHYFCDFDVIDPHTVSVEEFRDRYMFRKPVLINTTLSDWSDPQLWSRDRLVNDYSNFLFDAGKSLELVLNSGIGTTNSTLAQYFLHFMQSKESLYPDNCVQSAAASKDMTTVSNHNSTNTTSFQSENRFDVAHEPMYIFDRSIWKQKDGFQFRYFKPLPYLHNNKEHDYGIFFVGISGTGASFHGHGETWCGVAYGRKRWFLYPPEVSPPGGFWPGYSMLDWYEKIYGQLTDDLPAHSWMFNRNHLVRRKHVFSRKTNTTNTENMWKDFGEGLWARKFDRQQAMQQLDSDSPIHAIMQGDCRTVEEEAIEKKMNKKRDDRNVLDALYDDNYLHSEREYDFHQHMLPTQKQVSPCRRLDHLYKPMECIQAEGQVLYVPEFWFHAVLNVGDVLAGAIQTSVSYSEWIELLDEVTLIEKDLDNHKRRKAHKKTLTDLEKQDKHRRLLRIHETMLRLAPNNAVHHFFVGYEYKVLEEFDKAIEYLSNAIRIDPTYIEAYLGLSDAYVQSNQNRKRNSDKVSEEELVLRIAYRLNPLHPQVKSKLANLLQESEQFTLAKKVRNSEPLPNVEESKHIKSQEPQRYKPEPVNQNTNFIKSRIQY